MRTLKRYINLTFLLIVLSFLGCSFNNYNKEDVGNVDNYIEGHVIGSSELGGKTENLDETTKTDIESGVDFKN